MLITAAFCNQVKLKQGLKTAMSISSEGNGYLQVFSLSFLFSIRVTFFFSFGHWDLVMQLKLRHRLWLQYIG